MDFDLFEESGEEAEEVVWICENCNLVNEKSRFSCNACDAFEPTLLDRLNNILAMSPISTEAEVEITDPNLIFPEELSRNEMLEYYQYHLKLNVKQQVPED